MKFYFTLLVLLAAVNVAVSQSGNVFTEAWGAVENFIGQVKVFFNRIVDKADLEILNSINTVILELETSGLTQIAEKLNQSAINTVGVLKNHLKINHFNLEIGKALKIMEKAFIEKIQEDIGDLTTTIEENPDKSHCWEDKSEDTEMIFEGLVTKVVVLVSAEEESFESKVSDLTTRMQSDIESISSLLDDRSQQEIMRFVNRCQIELLSPFL